MRLPFNFRSKVTPSCATAIAVSLLPLIYFFPATRGNLIISPDDGVIFNIPIRVAVANIIRAGHLPLWNPYVFGGMPLFGAAQAGVLFPLNWFYLLFSIPVATNLMMLSSYVLAALGAYLYARRTGASIAGAALTSLVWQWSGFLIGQIGHTNILHTAALLPWLLWQIDGYGATGKRSRGVLLAVLVALQVFAGHQQTLSYALLVSAAYAVVRWRGSRSATPARAAYLWALVFIAAGLALAAVQILPTLELLRNSLRADASYDFFTSFSLPRRFLWTFFAPYVMGGGDGQLFRAPYVGPAFYGEYVGYVGVAAIALAGLAVVLKRDVVTKFWTLVAVVCFLLALGRYAPFHFYRLIYFVPVLNLFRVPARHLMEVEFALAVLAGRGLTAITAARDRGKTMRWALMTGVVVFALTCLAITVGRPADFHLGRTAPVSILRAPELFLPLVIAALSVSALCFVASQPRRTRVLLLLLVAAVDLVVWGQSTGWRLSSPTPQLAVWTEPVTVPLLRAHAGGDKNPYRILTEDQPFDPAVGLGPSTPGRAWEVLLQPDIYMMHGVENAAGYDGFGMARYSHLAGDMKFWGELTDATRTLGNDSRELDLLNVRYLLARSAFTSPPTSNSEPPDGSDPANNMTNGTADFPVATEVYGGQQFGAEELDLPTLTSGQRLLFSIPPTRVDRIALLTNLAWSEAVPNGTVVAHLRLKREDGKKLNLELRAGEHTSEWAYDRSDTRSRIKHQRAPLGTSYEVEDPQGKYEAHTYAASLPLSAAAVVTGGELTVARVPAAPELILSVHRIALADADRTFPVRRQWVKKELALNAEKQPAAASKTEQKPAQPELVQANQRWQPIGQVENVAVFENTRVLPRAWLATEELVATGETQIDITRSGKTPAGESWNPLQTALVESPTGIQFRKTSESPGHAEITTLDPNKVEVKTEASGPALLVLSANHYPGWRAYVDGQSADTMRVNYNLRGVAVPAGAHLVTFVYWPKSVLIGLMISLLTLVALLWW
ncbi:MAG: YfhO family protein, partial [bacterium]